ncbi:unnamed protein product, partial [Ectocarpus sp. 12 AP-2014]
MSRPDRRQRVETYRCRRRRQRQRRPSCPSRPPDPHRRRRRRHRWQRLWPASPRPPLPPSLRTWVALPTQRQGLRWLQRVRRRRQRFLPCQRRRPRREGARPDRPSSRRSRSHRGYRRRGHRRRGHRRGHRGPRCTPAATCSGRRGQSPARKRVKAWRTSEAAEPGSRRPLLLRLLLLLPEDTCRTYRGAAGGRETWPRSGCRGGRARLPWASRPSSRGRPPGGGSGTRPGRVAG